MSFTVLVAHRQAQFDDYTKHASGFPPSKWPCRVGWKFGTESEDWALWLETFNNRATLHLTIGFDWVSLLRTLHPLDFPLNIQPNMSPLGYSSDYILWNIVPMWTKWKAVQKAQIIFSNFPHTFWKAFNMWNYHNYLSHALPISWVGREL